MDNIAALEAFGEWIELLKAEGVYDNSRIIVVADHGYPFGNFPEIGNVGPVELESIMPLLLCKDFGDKGYKTSDKMMTNAYIPLLATRDLIDDPVNPITGKRLDDIEEPFIVQVYNDEAKQIEFWKGIGNDFYSKDSWIKVEK